MGGELGLLSLSYHEEQGEVVFHALPRLSTREVGAVLEQAVPRMARYLARRGLLGGDGVDSREGGTTAKPNRRSRKDTPRSARRPHLDSRRPPDLSSGGGAHPLPACGKPLAFDKPLCASVDGFTLHAATRAGGLDARAREALLKYVLRGTVANAATFLRDLRGLRLDDQFDHARGDLE